MHPQLDPASYAADLSGLRERFRALEAPRLTPGLRGLVWGLCGRVGHALFRHRPPERVHPSGLRLLHLGCGDRRLEGWVNADFYRLHHILLRHPRRADWFLDLTRPFACEDDTWDGVFLEHVNEHLLYSQNLDLLAEVFRVLKPGGVLRVSAPSLHRYLEWSRLRAEVPKMARYASLAEAVSNLTQNHLHRSVWSPELMVELLERLGFADVRATEFRDSRCPVLAQDAENHRWESLYVEGTKPGGAPEPERRTEPELRPDPERREVA